MQRCRCLVLFVGVLASASSPAAAQDRETKVRNDRKLLESSDHWIYNDLDRALREARLKKRAVLVVMRCIPCEACHEFDEQVVEREPRIRDLLDQFVCVRIPQANGIDLSLFNYDYDLSFAVLYLHRDGGLLGRFGTRTGRDNEQADMHIDGFAESLTLVLELERNFDQQQSALAGKRGPAAAFKSPELFPSLKDKYTDSLDYQGKVVQSCIHCHQVREAERLVFRTAGKPVPDELMFPWPGLDVIGLKCDPKTASTIANIAENSIAAKAGLQPGDRLLTMNGQPLVSVADAQWVLQQTSAAGEIAVTAARGRETVQTRLELPKGWRRAADISWRATTWDLRRMAFGGMLLESLPQEKRNEVPVAADQLALQVKHVGQYGEHARAKQAGIQKDDIIVRYDGRTDLLTESALLAYAMQQKQPGDSVAIEVLRGGRRKSMTISLR